MAIQCPYCQHALGLKGVKPGRYSTKCPKCSQKFQMVVSDDPAAPPVVSPIGAAGTSSEPSSARAQQTAAGPAETVATGGGAGAMPTVAATSPPSAPAKDAGTNPPQTIAVSPAAETQATSAWAPASERPTRAASSAGGGASQGYQLASAVAAAADASLDGAPKHLGGYQVIKELGRGGMGAVYLARQLSLDRDVALKVMRPEWASNPTFVSRFTREAYAAAQLTHHNVVQIYDFGRDRDTSFFSMEFVRGQTLSQVVKDQKKLDPEVAVGYILQAARGLKYAHDQSMIHRDIKPDNLLLNDQGVVKVADLGLVKTPSLVEVEVAREEAYSRPVAPAPSRASRAESSSPITLVNVAMGTPAYMAPEQARDASNVDARADIYSLGCTLYALVTGRPPFEGKTAVELMSKHQTEPIVPPEAVVKRVPKALSEIILKMVAKRPEDRHANLGEVINALEDYLGISSAAPFSPREEHANLLAECVETFNQASTVRLRRNLVLGGAAACAALAVVSLLARQPMAAVGFIALGLMTALAYFFITGITEKTHLFVKVRELVFSSSIGDWLMALASIVLLVTIVVVFHLHWVLIGLGVLAVLLAVGFHVAVDRKAQAERRDAISQVEEMLRGMRLHALEEETLRQFVCKYSGDNWEEFYESLFGYEAKRLARDRWGRGERGVLRRKYGAWRDPIVGWVEAKQKARREARERKLIQSIEEKGLEAQGVNLVTARRKARRSADAMVAMASEMKQAAKLPAADRRAIGRALREAVQKPEDVLEKYEKGHSRPWFERPLNAVIGQRPRFLAGAALVAGCLLWMNQNAMLSKAHLVAAAEQAKKAAAEAGKAAEQAYKTQDVNVLRDVNVKLKVPIKVQSRTRPLNLPMLPAAVTRLFNSFNPGVAGLILLVSSFFRGIKIGFFAVPAAAITLLGPALGMPSVGPVDAQTASMGAGVVLGLIGAIVGRK